MKGWAVRHMAISLHADPVALFNAWRQEADTREPNDPTAACLATATRDGAPSARMVLVKTADDDGFVFYTNLGSRKADELGQNPRAALCCHWKSLRRQVRIEGVVGPVADAEADAYFASRSRASRIGAWASRQSAPLASRHELERRVARFTVRFGVGSVPRPPFWSGFRLVPVRIEFWSDGAFRLHDRVVFRRETPADEWLSERLFP